MVALASLLVKLIHVCPVAHIADEDALSSSMAPKLSLVDTMSGQWCHVLLTPIDEGNKYWKDWNNIFLFVRQKLYSYKISKNW